MENRLVAAMGQEWNKTVLLWSQNSLEQLIFVVVEQIITWNKTAQNYTHPHKEMQVKSSKN